LKVEQLNQLPAAVERDSPKRLVSPFDPLLPILLARDGVDALQLFATAGETNSSPALLLPQRERFADPDGLARYGEWIYFQVLESGLRVPPTAGTATSLEQKRRQQKTPLGTARVYVHCGDNFTADEWWNGLQAGRVFVTNGPLLRPAVLGQPPGYVFRMQSGGKLDLEIGLELATRDVVEYLQIIRNGETEYEVRLDEFAKQGGRLPALYFQESGWFTLRAVTNRVGDYQRAIAGPYYVELQDRPRINRDAAQFFLDWLDQLPASVPASDVEVARRFWKERVRQASAD
jgi:hypothetical protein